MKKRKLLAIIVALMLFESFFIIGLMNFEPKKAIEFVYLEPAKTIEICPFNETGKNTVVYGIGVHEDNVSGELIEITLEVKPGLGRTFFDTTLHAYGDSLQDSIPTVIYYVEKHTNQTMQNKDLYVGLNSLAHNVDGTSASAAMAVGLISLLENKFIDDSIAMTGTLSRTGRLIRVEGVNVKIDVAKEIGIDKILIPDSQCGDYTGNSSIEIICVDSIDDAIPHMLY